MSCSSILLYQPQKAEAVGLGVPIDTMLNFHSIQNYLKEFTLDKLAVMVANQLLQKMTASIVNWINTGFEGSPAFLTNPEGFFLDVGDQVTGEFLDKAGVLSSICSPFSFDLRLNIALNQSTYATKRYTCTLGKIIGNTRNAIATAGQNSGITVSGDPNGATLGNFIDGDFSQGGWGGYIAYTTEPQNNAFGAYLLAQSDLQARISEKKTAVNTDLNRGQGFLSWQKCTDVTSSFQNGGAAGHGLTGIQENQLRNSVGDQTTVITGKTQLDKPTSVSVKLSPEGDATYQDCQTQTPGSVIGGSLQRQLDVPADKLVLVKTISDSIDAMLGALVNQMFTKGLAALSGNGSSIGGRNQSYLVQLSEEADNLNSAGAQSIRTTSGSASNAIVNIAKNNAAAYQQGIDSLLNSRRDFITAKECFVVKVSTRPLLTQAQKNYAQAQISTIDNIVHGNIDVLIASTTLKKIAAENQAAEFERVIASATNGRAGSTDYNTNEFDNGFSRVDNAVAAGSNATQAGITDSTTAQTDLRTIQTLTTKLTEDAKKYQTACDQFPNGFYGQ